GRRPRRRSPAAAGTSAPRARARLPAAPAAGRPQRARSARRPVARHRRATAASVAPCRGSERPARLYNPARARGSFSSGPCGCWSAFRVSVAPFIERARDQVEHALVGGFHVLQALAHERVLCAALGARTADHLLEAPDLV